MKTKLETMNMKPWRVAMAGLSLALVSPLTWAAAAIQAITSTQQAGADVVLGGDGGGGEVSDGDEVIYSKYGGTEVKYAGEEYLVLSARDLLAVVEK